MENDDEIITSTQSIQTPYGEQDENGTDLSLIRMLLSMSPQERLRHMDAATTDMQYLGKHARRVESSPT